MKSIPPDAVHFTAMHGQVVLYCVYIVCVVLPLGLLYDIVYFAFFVVECDCVEFQGNGIISL